MREIDCKFHIRTEILLLRASLERSGAVILAVLLATYAAIRQFYMIFIIQISESICNLVQIEEQRWEVT
jgi:hypothetical protein